jgi:hypothetical protein
MPFAILGVCKKEYESRMLAVVLSRPIPDSLSARRRGVVYESR